MIVARKRRILFTLGLIVLLGMMPTSSHALGGIGGGVGGGGAVSSDQLVKDTWIAGFQAMTAQWSAGIIHQAGMIGTMIDGQNLNNSQNAKQTLAANTYRDYTPGENLCRFGTLTRSLAAANLNVDTTALAVHQILLDRENNNAAHQNIFTGSDRVGKLHNLGRLYCNPGDNDATPIACACDMAKGTCDASNGPLPARSNRDLDFTRLIETRGTLNLNFTDGTLTSDEQDALAFLSNVVAFSPLPANTEEMSKIAGNPSAVLQYQNARALTAARGVVRNNLAHFVAEKSAGTDGANVYMINVLREMGMSDKEARRTLTGTGLALDRNGNDPEVAPSYDAQMDVMTKKLYQNPNFYAGLVDKPANVLRTQTAMAAIGLIQRRDLYETALRREMALSQLLEAAIRTEEKLALKRVSAATNHSN